MIATGSFTTSDGVEIGYRQVGSGPPHDRRGRGMSGDAHAYSLDREADDFVEAALRVGGGEPVAVIAYSYGATAALRRGTRPAPVRALVVYEAPFGVPGIVPKPDGVVAEEGGNPAYREIAAMVSRIFPGADVAPVPGIPHFAHASEPAAFVSRALEHLDRYA